MSATHIRVVGWSRMLILVVVVAATCVPLSGRSTVVEYSVSPLGSDSYRYDFSVFNDTLVESIYDVTLFFDRDLFPALCCATVPNGWDPLVVPPDLGLPSDGFFDALAIDPRAEIGPGQSAAIFSATVQFAGAGPPGAPRFEVYDSEFNLLDSGLATMVPEPDPVALVGVGLVALALVRRVASSRLTERRAP